MADTFSTNLALRLIATGAYSNTWGGVLNADALALIDAAFGETVINLGAGTTYSMAALTPGAASESRAFALLVQGVPASAVTITVPASVIKKFYLVENQCGQTITFMYAGSVNTVTVLTGSRVLVWANGTDTFQVQTQATDSASLGGIPAASYARRDIANTFASTNTFVQAVNSPVITLTDGSSISINAAIGNNFGVQIAANRTIPNPTNPSDGQLLNIIVQQDAVGGRTVTWGNLFVWAGGVPPVLSQLASHSNRILALYSAVLGVWLAADAGTYNTSGVPDPTTTAPITISQNTKNVRLIDMLGTGLGAATVNVVINKGVVVGSDSTLVPAFDCSGFDSGATINIINNGYILGKGGDGGHGASAFDENGPNAIAIYGRAGQPGGTALKGVGVGITLNVTNANGFIWGGGGGGGGGGASQTISTNSAGGGGGGGGGAGGGAGGLAPNFNNAFFTGPVIPGEGQAGTIGSTGTFGAHGTGSSPTPSGGGSDGGDGGDWGTIGTAGVANSAGTFVAPPGAAGAAGKAVDLFSGTINFVSGSTGPNVKGAVS